MVELAGQVAIVTGATSGIGMALARALDARGVRLVLTGRRADRLDALVAELGAARAVAGDITDPVLPGRLVEAALEAHGRLDIACNNAGLLAFGTIEEIDLERMATMVRVNVEATYRFAYTVLRHFKAQNHGHLVNTSSVAGTKVRPTIGAYAGTKHAIEALAHGLRMELATTDVRISNVQPGLVATDIFAHMPADEHPGRQQGIDQPLRPEDVARAVLFMLEQPAHVSIPTLMLKPTHQPM
ncbi:MAG: SDR family oxidoreductase [Geminicoccaceae bacterium]|jgi:NADP-dependent 3-hydroxy acid dehydrogenase YdfG|nr:SDR family oxidoreductase [Geminicoccaceae bacterium]HRY24562.1 SDR family oxidoreductase [Geminicoccaceae bacterium]